MSPSGATNQRGPALQEQDYMGLAEISSSSLLKQQEMAAENLRSSEESGVSMEVTDLRLGLGPPERHLSFSTDASFLRSAWLRGSNTGNFIPTNTILTQTKEVVPACGHRLDVDSTPEVTVKCGLKRGYSEAMSEIRCRSRPGMVDKSPDFPSQARTVTRASGNMKNAFQPSGTDGIVPPQHMKFQHPSSLHCGWAARTPAGLSLRQFGLDHPNGSSETYTPLQAHATPNSNQDADMTRPTFAVRAEDHQETQEDASHKGQVVGWPPIRSFRKTTLAAHPKSTGAGEGVSSAVDNSVAASGHAQGSQPSLYVKVNMDGVPVGRKVDLGAYNSYEDLSRALKEMFQLSNNGQEGPPAVLGRPCDESKSFHFHEDFSLTYEDTEGDWMLVGDLPWSNFVNTICRLRIVKNSKSSGTVSRTTKRSQCHR